MSGLEVGPLGPLIESWQQLEELMTQAAQSLGRQDAGAVPPAVRGEATAFLSAWEGYAGESAGIARGFVSALHSTSAAYDASDHLSAEQLRTLDGRLGPSR